MWVALAQTQPHPGDIFANLQDHLGWMHQAAATGAELVVFPELSLSGYEPELAQNLALTVDSEPLQRLQEVALSLGQRVCVGFPSPGERLPRISMAILGAPEVTVLHKHHLHQDEVPFFEAGPASDVVELCGMKVGFLICYELTQDAHVARLMAQSAEVLIASVAKTASGMAAAGERLRLLAERHDTWILAVNCVGSNDGVVCGGGTGTWRPGGRLGALDDCTPGVFRVGL